MTKDVKNNKNTVVQEPAWKQKGFPNSTEYHGWLSFNNLVHVSDYDGVSVDDSENNVDQE